jgi:hypothetical protein
VPSTVRRHGKRRRYERNELGIFTNFSPMIHGFAKASFTCHTHEAQQVLLDTFEELNGHQETRNLSVGEREGEIDGRMGFEVGLAEGNFFVYFDKETSAGLASFLEQQKRFRPLDFLLIATYYYTRKEKEVPLKFDYHILRFLFGHNELDVVLHHVKGTRRLPIDELLTMFFDRFERKVKERHLGTAIVKQIRTA